MEAPLILVVDDSGDMREPLARLLQHRGYRTIEAADGREALGVLREHRDTALILLDLLMPTLDGWAFREQQLGDSTIAAIPVVVFSVAKHTEFVRYPLRARAVLHKPLSSLDDIFAAVQECCGPGADSAPLHAGEKTKWAAAFLRGRARAFTRGNVPYAAVLTAIRLAQRHEVSTDAIRAMLAMQDLVWDSANGDVRPFSPKTIDRNSSVPRR